MTISLIFIDSILFTNFRRALVLSTLTSGSQYNPETKIAKEDTAGSLGNQAKKDPLGGLTVMTRLATFGLTCIFWSD